MATSPSPNMYVHVPVKVNGPGLGAMSRRTSGDSRVGAPGSSLVRSWSIGSDGMGGRVARRAHGRHGFRS